jgi:predicted transcriptional regulator
MSEDTNNTRRGRRQSSPQFRNIPLSPEIIATGFTDIQVQAHNMMLRHQDGLMVITKYDETDLTKTGRFLESKLAEYVGKPAGLPGGFDPKKFSTQVSLALMRDIQDKFQQKQEDIQEEKKRVTTILDEIKTLREENSDLDFNEWQKILIGKYLNLKATVQAKFPKLWPGLEFGLTSLRILNIDDCTLPLVAILLGRPGSGKTVPMTLLAKWTYGFYTDNFTPKSWISHSTTAESQEDLELIDMLPKIRNKQFLTPELATLFNLKEDDLRVAIGTIIRLADGNGFASDSGAWGHRAYGEIMFTWLGAIVDIPHHVYKVLSQFGPKLYFFRLPYTEITQKDVYTYLTNREDFNTQYKAIEVALNDYLKWFEIGPTLLLRTPDSPHLVKMKWDSSRNDLNAIKCISNLAMLLGSLRREGAAWSPKDKAENADTEYFAGPMEDVIRAGQVLTNLASGHALITGRNYIRMEDIPIVLKTVLSTARIQRVTSFIALLDNKGKITVSEMSRQISVSHSTAYRLATELMAVGLVDLTTSNDVEYLPDINNPAMQKVLILKNEFEWCLSDEFKQLREGFTPVDNRKFMKEKDPEQHAVKEAADIKTQQRAAYDTARAKIAKAKRKK